MKVRSMCSKRNELNKEITKYRSQLSNVCSLVLLLSIRTKIQALNSKLSTPNSFTMPLVI